MQGGLWNLPPPPHPPVFTLAAMFGQIFTVPGGKCPWNQTVQFELLFFFTFLHPHQINSADGSKTPNRTNVLECLLRTKTRHGRKVAQKGQIDQL